MKRLTGLLTLISLLLGTNVFGQVIEDKVYKDHIQSVRLFPMGETTGSQLDAPVVSINGGRPLVLFFDDLAYDPELYTAKLIHCDADWQQSALKNNDFLIAYNEFNVQDYDYSVNTRIPYIHYEFKVPRVTKSGNYVVKVYRRRDESEVILTKRFMVYEDLLTVGAAVVPPTQTAGRRGLQQVNTIVNYSKVDVTSPETQIKIVVRQNQRWDNAKFLSKPTFMNQSTKVLRYEDFDGDNTFDAGNEFRFIDLRFMRARGQNIASMRVEEDAVFGETLPMNPRPTEAYSQYLDLNGQYIVDNNDRPGGDPEVESQYVYMTFQADIPQSNDPLYLIGALTNWGKTPEAKMEWSDKFNVYQTSMLLKQGWYDFQLGYLEGDTFVTNTLEGSYFETENIYEVMVYYRALGSRYDQLVGYVVLQPNKRRL
ncbi:type IX secretion system plug protein [Algoriphagus machipongonensis]|uniref:Type 9 secretion system plug protein N-terminal domain-containing protein n=1 Tax=Algoriphagus machipongonensis TaxID=388413 RepID=A3I0J6_9BACT|nr:DUF5103 domain-containing protein [Algoriphagus machipongonensis]EAZ79992.2 hypothetical protein ALPR1_15224 [Algoriphagus machipongonensis]